MNYYIGEAATISKLEKELDLNENFVSMGIGWLAQEGKADLSGKGARTKVRLINSIN